MKVVVSSEASNQAMVLPYDNDRSVNDDLTNTSSATNLSLLTVANPNISSDKYLNVSGVMVASNGFIKLVLSFPPLPMATWPPALCFHTS
jgi:hypothetical protein